MFSIFWQQKILNRGFLYLIVMKRTWIIICLVAFVSSLYAQKQVTGTCVNNADTPISDVVVTMFAGDTTLFEVTDSAGTFSLPLLADSFALHFDHIAYTRLQKIYTTPNIGNVVLESTNTELEDVVVTAYRPIVKVEDGALRYDLTQLAQGTTSTNVYEVITKLPGVEEKDGALELAGAGTVTVIINGKPSNMTAAQLETYLSAMPVERIKSADVMYSAPPQYNVRGAVINLVIDRSQDHRYSGEVSTNYTYKAASSEGASGSFMVSHPKWSTDVIYQFNEFRQRSALEQTAHHTVADSTYLIQQQNANQSYVRQHFVRANFDYTPKDNQVLSLSYVGTFTPDIAQTQHSNGTFVNSNSLLDSKRQTQIASIRYQDPCGLDIGANYTYYNTDMYQALHNKYDSGDSTSVAFRQGQIASRVNVHADMKHKFKQKWGLTYGFKGSWAQTEDTQLYDEVSGNVDAYDVRATSTEWNAEVYVGGSVNFSKGSLSASIAGEYNNWNGQGRFNFYPQANFSWMFSQDHILQANFMTSKGYPSYWMLQNSITYVDGYTEVHGNALLRPKMNYTAQGVYYLKQRYMFALFYMQTNDYFSQTAYMAPDRLALIHKHINFDRFRYYGFTTSIPFTFADWHKSTLQVQGMRMRQECSDYFGLSFDRGCWVANVSLNNSFQLCKKPNIALDIDGGYQSPSIQGLYDLDHSWVVNAGLKFAFLKDALKLTLKANDIFESQMPHCKQDFNGQQYELYTGAYTRSFFITLSYNFGGYTSKQRQHVDTSRFGH